MLAVVIDDERTFMAGALPDHIRAHHCRTSREGFDRIMQASIDGEIVDELWLDHDLGGDDNIRDLVLMMVEDAHNGAHWPVEQVYIHTANPVGRRWLETTLFPYYPAYLVDAVTHGLVKPKNTEDD